MKNILSKLELLENSQDRKRLLEECSDITTLTWELDSYRSTIKTDSDRLLRDSYISWAWMIKVRILDTWHGILTLNIFWNNHTAWKIPENIHVHDFQAISYVARGEINEEQFSFQRSTWEQEEIYTHFVEVMSSIWYIEQIQILGELEARLLQNSNAEITPELQRVLSLIWVTIDELIWLYVIFNGEKEIDSTWTVTWERFNEKWVYNLSFDWRRKIQQWESYFLPDYMWHRIDSWDNTTTLFLVDKTFKTKWFPKTKNLELTRWHAKKLPQQQAEYEDRWYSSYNISPKELLRIVNGEIEYILN